MHVTLRQLAIFQAVAEQLSFTRAAEVLHLSQPAVSMQIRQLEENVGLPLFEQLGRKVYLTEAGEELNDYSKAISRQLQEAEEVLNALKGITAGRLRVAVASTANVFAARMLAAFARQHPGVSVSLDATNRERLLRQLDANEADLVIMGRPPEGLDVEADAFMDNPLVVIAAPDHPLVGEECVSMERLAQETFVVRERGSGTRTAMESFFSKHQVTLKTGMELGGNESLKQVVAAGLGLAMVSAHTIDLELEAGQLAVLDVEDLPLMRHWYIVQRRGKRLAPIAKAFRQFVLGEAERFVDRDHLTAIAGGCRRQGSRGE